MTTLFASRIGLSSFVLTIGLHALAIGGCGVSVNGTDAQTVAFSVKNGLSTNGLSTNGLSTNGLSSNGLSPSGLLSSGFLSWFESNSFSVSDMVMKYVVRCALPAGESRTFFHEELGTSMTYVWMGGLGLAPDWAEGFPATLIEQQLVSACLAAHVNKYGVSVPVSILGYDARGIAIPLSYEELTEFPVKEGCFFGNLFNGDGVYAGYESVFSSSESSARECAITGLSHSKESNCLPMKAVGACSALCIPDASHTTYLSCGYNGQSYPVISTRLPPDLIFRCGDSVCQVSERCGTSYTPDSCTDCGPCS